jgi:hypothetical protein
MARALGGVHDGCEVGARGAEEMTTATLLFLAETTSVAVNGSISSRQYNIKFGNAARPALFVLLVMIICLFDS